MSPKSLRKSFESAIQTTAKHLLFGIMITGGLVNPALQQSVEADLGPENNHAESTAPQAALVAVPDLKATASLPRITNDMVAVANGAARVAPAKVVGSHFVNVTAYTSSPEETDDTPFETAMGTRTRDGIVAANFLPFGTRIKIPKLFGDKIFVVEDRMNRKYSDRVDIWVETKAQAYWIGIRNLEIIVLE